MSTCSCGKSFGWFAMIVACVLFYSCGTSDTRAKYEKKIAEVQKTVDEARAAVKDCKAPLTATE